MLYWDLLDAGHMARNSEWHSPNPSSLVNDEVQVSPMGFSAPIIVWDYAGRKLLHKLILHKVCDFGL